MPAVDLTPFLQPQGSVSDGSKFGNMLAYIQTILNGLDNGNISPGAAIAYTKLALAGKINLASDVDTATSLAIARLAGYPADSSKALMGDGSWATVGSANVGTQLDYAQITADVTGITATTEGTATAVITGNSVAYDGTKVRIEFQCSGVTPTTADVHWVVLRDTTVLGQIGAANGVQGSGLGFSLYDTPTAASHVYKVAVFTGGAQTIAVKADVGGSTKLLPAYLRVTKA